MGGVSIVAAHGSRLADKNEGTFDFWKTSLISGRLLARCGYKKRSPLYVLRNKKNKKKFKNRCNGVTYVTEGLGGQ